MKKLCAVIAVFFFFQVAYAQYFFESAGSAWLDAANYAPRAADVFAGTANPAAIPYLTGFSVGAYAEKKYMLSGLALGKLVATASNGSSGAGAFLKYFGNPVYHEWQAAGSFAKKLGDVQLGLSFTFHRYTLAGLGRVTNMGSGLFTVWKLSGDCVAAIAILNPPFLRVSTDGPVQSGEYRLAFCFDDTPSVALSAELRMMDRAPPVAMVAIKYHLNRQYEIKAGILSTGPQYFIGFSCHLLHWTSTVALAWHPALGTTPGYLIQYQSTPLNDQP